MAFVGQFRTQRRPEQRAAARSPTDERREANVHNAAQRPECETSKAGWLLRARRHHPPWNHPPTISFKISKMAARPSRYLVQPISSISIAPASQSNRSIQQPRLSSQPQHPVTQHIRPFLQPRSQHNIIRRLWTANLIRRANVAAYADFDLACPNHSQNVRIASIFGIARMWRCCFSDGSVHVQTRLRPDTVAAGCHSDTDEAVARAIELPRRGSIDKHSICPYPSTTHLDHLRAPDYRHSGSQTQQFDLVLLL
jgi:hypothetical protein